MPPRVVALEMYVVGISCGVVELTFTPRRANYVNVTLALRTTRFLSQEVEYMPWAAALNNLQYFQLMFDRSEVFGVMTVSGATALQRVLCQGAGLRARVCTQSWAVGCCQCHHVLTALLSPRNTSRIRCCPSSTTTRLPPATGPTSLRA